MAKYNIVIEKKYSLNNRQIKIHHNAEKNITIEAINQIRNILKIKNILSPKEYFKKLIFQLNINEEIPWLDFLPKHKINEYFCYLKKEIKDSEIFITSYFLNAYIKRKQLFNLLVNVKQQNNKEIEIPEYLHDTVTGRSRIINGFNFLTMKKESKNKLRPFSKEHNLFEIDFKSCEPYFYLHFIKKSNLITTNVYDLLASLCNANIACKEKFKRGCLAILYGAPYMTVKRISNITETQYSQIISFLEIKDFKTSFSRKFNDLGCFYNFYNRPLLQNNSLVNHWIQSSVADYCCLAFGKFVKENSDVIPHAIIHDAMIFSYPKNKKIDVKFLSDDISNFKIPVRIKRLF